MSASFDPGAEQEGHTSGIDEGRPDGLRRHWGVRFRHHQLEIPIQRYGSIL